MRLGLAVSIPLVLGFIALPPVGRHPPFLFCGFHAASGLPCLFCGGTRAVRAILRGDLREAVYLNAIAFPALAIVAAQIAPSIWSPDTTASSSLPVLAE